MKFIEILPNFTKLIDISSDITKDADVEILSEFTKLDKSKFVKSYNFQSYGFPLGAH